MLEPSERNQPAQSQLALFFFRLEAHTHTRTPVATSTAVAPGDSQTAPGTPAEPGKEELPFFVLLYSSRLFIGSSALR